MLVTTSLGRRRTRRHAIVLASVGLLAMAGGGCRDLVDDFFGSEQPSDPPTDYGIEFVVAKTQPRGTKSSLLYVQASAPRDAYVALRVVDGRIAPLGPESSSDDSVACFCIGAGVNQLPILVSGTSDDSSVLFAGIFEKPTAAEVSTVDATPSTSVDATSADAADDASDASDASETSDASSTGATSSGSLACEAFSIVPQPQCDGGRCRDEQYVFGICPPSVLKIVRARGAVALPATDASTGADASTDAAADADAARDGGADAAIVDAGGEGG